MKSPSTHTVSRSQRFLRGAVRRSICKNDRRHSVQRGYAILLVMFFVAVLAASAMAVIPSVLTEGRRQQEEEMIWRGEQYKRGIRAYYRKLGKFPTSLDDLTKPKTGTIRFMRAAYKDPMNKEDGSWRLIYVGPAGQLIGSLKPQQNLQIQGAQGFGTSASAVAGASTGSAPQAGSSSGFGNSSSFGSSSGFGNSSSFGSSSGNANSSAFGSPAGGAGFGNAGAAGAVDNSQPYDPATDPMLNPPAGAGSDFPTIIGGNIIGVGSKINKHSIKVYEKAKNYLVFEFVWNPAKDAANAVQQLNAPGANGLGTPIGNQQSPFGQAPTSGTPPSGTTGTPPSGAPPPQNPQQTPPPQ